VSDPGAAEEGDNAVLEDEAPSGIEGEDAAEAQAAQDIGNLLDDVAEDDEEEGGEESSDMMYEGGDGKSSKKSKDKQEKAKRK